MKQPHTTCRVNSDSKIMRLLMTEERVICAFHDAQIVFWSSFSTDARSGLEALPCISPITSPKLKTRLERQGVPRNQWRRKIVKYMYRLNGCQLCQNYIGRYPDG